jgi:hypothetical protein
MIIHLSSLSSFLDDGCHHWFEERGLKVSLLGSLANDKNSIDRILGGEIKCCANFMWDSGAVSVRNKKTEITLDMYANWVKNIKQTDVPITIVGLDVIGDAEASQQNYLKLKYDFGFGTNFLPVFHYGEDIHYLEFLIKEGFTYIGLGGVGAGDRLGQDSLRDWLRSLLLTESNGLRYPGIKFHGFAMTSFRTLQEFPLYSVDSATWVKNSAIGKILTPWGDWRISNDPRSGYDTQHIKRAGPNTLKRIRDWVESLGLNWNELPEDRYQKHIVNTNYFKWIEDNWKWKPMISSTSVFSALGKEDKKVKRISEKISLASVKAPPPKEEIVEELIIEEVRPTEVTKEISQESIQTTPIFRKPPAFNPSVSDTLVSKLSIHIRQQQDIIKNDVSPVVTESIEPLPTAKFGATTLTSIICPHCYKPFNLELKTTS